MFGGFDQKPKKRERAPSQEDQARPPAKRQRKAEDEKREVSDESSEDELRDEERLIKDVEALIQVKEVENSTLKMGYNESDYEYTRQEYPNCIHEYVAPAGYCRPEKFVRPTEMAKQYKFKLDKFQEKAVECI